MRAYTPEGIVVDSMGAEEWDRLNSLWAKLSRSRDAGNSYHPLLAHMIDVAQVTRTMWRDVMPQAACQTIASELGVTVQVAEYWVALWAGAHDLGKASPAFARQNVQAWERIRQAGFACPVAPPPIKAPHGVVTAYALPALLTEQLGVPRALGSQVGRLVGGHHGTFPRAEDVQTVAKHRDAVGGRSWALARGRLVMLLPELLGVEGSLPEPARLSNATVMYLAGLVSVADWIGSNAEFFKYAISDPGVSEPIDWPAYPGRAEKAAHKALRRLGWLGWSRPTGRPTFTELFPFVESPNVLQETVIDLADALAGPSLVVIEAPMGEGKTEAALFLADRWGAQLGQRGIYVALPTQATSNQMFGRVRRFLEHRHSGEVVNLQLLHGHAALSAELQTLRDNELRLFQPSNVHGEDEPRGDATVVAAEWFTYRKRGLLAPFGVGTIDQALLAVLKTRHGFVRLFGLGHKTIVIDEVHAYDTYMTTLLEQLLRWLATLGASVVLLSATLPRARLDALLDAFAAGRAVTDGATRSDPSVPYPRITWIDGAGVGTLAVPPSSRTTAVRLERLTCDLPPLSAPQAGDSFSFELGERLATALAAGGCAAIICTTVGRAQRMYAALGRCFDALPLALRPDLDLFHARYPFGERDRREKRALVRFGKPGETVVMTDGVLESVERPHRAVLVATQVIEQSLDLDFDLMVSELAPVDLVLQRVGRLHRHVRPDRPSHLAVPTLWLLQPAVEDGAPAFERDQQAVYHPHVLLRSWLALDGRDNIRVPDDVEELVEHVYRDRPCPSDAPSSVQSLWSRSKRDLAELRHEQQDKAKEVVLVAPTYEDDIFELFNPRLEEDDPTVHRSLQAQTRLTEPSVPVVLLTPDEEALADLGANRPDIERVRVLLERSVTLSHRGLVAYLFGKGADVAQPPPSWKRSALLRHHRLIHLGAAGSAEVGSYEVRLDRDLGILVERQM